MAKVALYDSKGKEKSSGITLDDAVFGIEPNVQSVFDAVNAQRASMRQGTHSVRNRSEVRGGGRKPWRQKGTGRARQGSIRSPQWRGGGIVFGPTPRSYSYSINKKVRRLALRSILSQKVLDKELKAIEELKFDVPKTKDFISIIESMELQKPLFVVAKKDENVMRSVNNIPNANVVTVQEFNAYIGLSHYDIVVTKDAAAKFGEVLA